MKKVAFLINKTIKNYRSVVRDIEEAFDGVAETGILTSEYAGHVRELAAEAVKEGFEYIITVGGDGTINETINGIMSQFNTGNGPGPGSYDWDAVKKIKYGVLPAGTGNDFARFFEIGPSVLELRNKITNENIKEVDIGHTTLYNISGDHEERFFMNITDVGMGGATVKHMARHRVSWLSPNLNYMKAIFSAFLTYDRTRVRWTSESDSFEGNVMSIVVANGKFFGSGLAVAPDAKMDDGLFELVTLADINMMDYIKNIGRIKSGKHVEHPEVTYQQARKVTIEPMDDNPLPIDMDGDFPGHCPMTLECIPRAISLLV